MKQIPLLVPRMPQAHKLTSYLQLIDQNQWYTNFGPLNSEFERRIIQDTATAFTADNVTTICNCTIGLELALQTLGLKPGAKVLIPSITFVATATAVVRCGFVPMFADVDPLTWVLTPEIARSALVDASLGAVMPVSTFGYAHDTRGWDEFLEETGVPVIIDAAGAYGNQLPGETTDVVYSFHATKSFGAAEGGVIISRNTRRIRKIRQLANFGIDTSTGLLADFGTNGKMSEYHCAVGLASFDEWEETKRARRKLYKSYLGHLAHHLKEATLQNKDPDGVYPLMPVALPRGINVEKTRLRLLDAGIETRRWYAPSLHTHPALNHFPTMSLPHALDLGQRILGLPFFIGLSDEQIIYICVHLAEIIDEYNQADPCALSAT